MTGQPDSETLTQNEAARRLGLSVKTIRRMLDRGDLTAVASGQRGGALRVLQDRKLDTFMSDSQSRESDTPIAKSDTPAVRAADETGPERPQLANRTPPRADSSPPARGREEPRPPVSPSDSAAPTSLAFEPSQELPDEDWVRLDPLAQRESPAQTLGRSGRARRAPIALLVTAVLAAGAVAAFALHAATSGDPVTSAAANGQGSTQTAGSATTGTSPSSPARNPAMRLKARGGAAGTVSQSHVPAARGSQSVTIRPPEITQPVAPAHPRGCDPVLRAEGLC